MDRPSTPPTLIYDQDCGLCIATAAWLARRVPRSRLDVVAIGEVEAQPTLATTLHDLPLAAALHFVRPDGSIRTGARAVLGAGLLVPRWRFVARALDHRVGHRLLEPVYRRIAANRRRIGRLLRLPAVCPMPARPGDR